MKFIISLIYLIGFALTENKVRYDNFHVYRITPATIEAVEALKNLQEYHLGYSFWTDGIVKNRTVDIMVPPHLQFQFNDLITDLELDVQLLIANVQHLIDTERPRVKSTKAFGWDDYYSLNKIHAWLDTLAVDYPRFVTVISGGTSYEGRDLKGVHVSFRPGNKNKSVFIESNIHAREWISSAVSTFILNALLTSTDPNVRAVAESHDWYFIPVTNPDGYEYTRSSNRMWRKTRAPYSGCFGVDLNRNWGYHYNNGGSSGYPCSEIYRGPATFSEPETKSLSKFLATIGPQLVGYIAFHSYSQLILLPYGYTKAHLDNFNDLYSVGQLAAESLAKRHGTNFDVGNAAEILYVTSGDSIDWVKGTYHTPITYTYELRDTGFYGFILPANQIIPSGEETLDSFIRIFQEFNAILLKKEKL